MAAARRTFPCLLVALAVLVPVGSGLGGVFAHGGPVLRQLGGGPLFRVADLRPGQTVARTVTIRNVGGADASVVVSAAARGDKRLARALVVTLSETSGRVLYRGPLSRLRADGGLLAAGTAKSYRLDAAVPKDAAVAGKHVTAAFSWTGTSD